MRNADNTGPRANGRPPGNGAEAPEGTLIGVVLDRSGSMESCREATIAGFNQFLQAQLGSYTSGEMGWLEVI